MRRPPRLSRASTRESRVEHPRHTQWRNVMSVDPDRTDEDVAKELLKPAQEVLAKDDEELKKVDEFIREAERKSRQVYHPEP
jgi:hypothetical protein